MVICGGVTLSVALLVLLRTTETYKMQAEFENQATEHAVAVERTIESKLVVLESLRAFLQSHYPKAERKQFIAFTHPLLARVHGIQALEWLPRVARGERAAFEAGAKREVDQHFQITERDGQGRMIRAGQREEYFPVLLMEPHEGNESALGYDPGSGPVRRRALAEARDTGTIIATDPIHLVQDKEVRSGFVVYLPLYTPGAAIETVQARRKHLWSFAAGVYYISSVIERALAPLSPRGIDMHVFDNSGTDTRPLYTHHSRLTPDRPSAHHCSEAKLLEGMNHTALIDIGGRRWSIVCTPAPAFVEARRTWFPWMALATGLTLTGLLAGFIIKAGRAAAREGVHTAELNQYACIVASSNDMLALLNRDFVHLAANTAYLTAFGKTRDEVVGHKVADVFGNEFFETVIRPHAEHCLAGKEVRYEDWFEFPAHGKQHMDIAFVPYRNLDETICGFIVSGRNVTGRKQAEERFVQAQKLEAIGQLAGGMAHDFRNQLTVIQGFAGMLRRHNMVTLEGQTNVDRILESVDRSTKLIGQLLAFSRKEILEPQIMDLSDMIAELGKSLPQLIGEDARLSISRNSDKYTANVDPNLFHQAIINLVINARDAMPQGGTLIIETDLVELDAESARLHVGIKPGRYVSILVEDSGVGMAEEVRKRVFEPFFTTKTVGEGTGLGLAMVYGFIKQSGGHIECESAPGQGTKFTILFPWIPAPAPSSQTAEVAMAPPSGSEHILVVEDEASVRGMIVGFLEEAGYLVVESADPGEALSILNEQGNPIDLLVTDVVMPNISGMELAQRIQAVRPDLRTLFVSGYAGQELTRRGADSVRKNLLVKPFTYEQLLRRVRAVLDSTGPQWHPAPKALAEYLRADADGQLAKRAHIKGLEHVG